MLFRRSEKGSTHGISIPLSMRILNKLNSDAMAEQAWRSCPQLADRRSRHLLAVGSQAPHSRHLIAGTS